MKGRFVRKVKGEGGTGDKTFLMINDPLAEDVEERTIIKMPTVGGRRRGVFKLIIEPWAADPLLAKEPGKA